MRSLRSARILTKVSEPRDYVESIPGNTANTSILNIGYITHHTRMSEKAASSFAHIRYYLSSIAHHSDHKQLNLDGIGPSSKALKPTLHQSTTRVIVIQDPLGDDYLSRHEYRDAFLVANDPPSGRGNNDDASGISNFSWSGIICRHCYITLRSWQNIIRVFLIGSIVIENSFTRDKQTIQC